MNNLKNVKLEQKFQMRVQWKMHNNSKDVSTGLRERKRTEQQIDHC